MDTLGLEDLDERLRSRVLAATAHAIARTIRHTEGRYVIDARSGDRFVHMSLSLRPDGTIAETTDTFLTSAVCQVRPVPGEETMEVVVRDPLRTVGVAAAVAATLGAPDAGDGASPNLA